MGYHRAGFEVVGVDIKPQKNYPFEFHQGDALEYSLDGFDAIHASPPCQAHTALRTAWNAKKHPDLLTPTLQYLRTVSIPWVVENVPGAPIRHDLLLCGTMFGLGLDNAELRRHRWFELNWSWVASPLACSHGTKPITIGVYGQHGRDHRRSVQTFFSVADGRKAMGIAWTTGDELSQAIPPAYTEYIGRQCLDYLQKF